MFPSTPLNGTDVVQSNSSSFRSSATKYKESNGRTISAQVRMRTRKWGAIAVPGHINYVYIYVSKSKS